MSCDRCKHGAPWVTDGGHATGFYRCAVGLRWVYVSPRAGCQFAPARFVQAAA